MSIKTLILHLLVPTSSKFSEQKIGKFQASFKKKNYFLHLDAQTNI